MMRLVAICAALMAAMFFASPALAWEATVLRVSDGDTVTVRRADTGDKVRIRLYGIDAPEGHGRNWGPQPYSRVASDFLKTLLPVGSACAVMDLGYDKYQRTVGGIISLPDGTVVQEELLKAGLAWVYPKYCHDCRQWTSLQDEAKASGTGLWRDEEPTPPWEWRKSGKR